MTASQRQEPGDPRAKAIEAMARALAAQRHQAVAVLAALEAEGWGLTATRRCEMCEGTRRIMVRFGGSLDSAVPCPSCGGSCRTTERPPA